MRTTADVYCKQFSMICTNVWLCSLPTFRATMLKCHESPHFLNQSHCDSRYLAGKNFIAQSWVMSIEASSSKFKQSILAWSCRTLRSWFAFQDVIASSHCLNVYNWSSNSSSGIRASFNKYLSISCRTLQRSSHWATPVMCMLAWGL